jgi:hypothetical protein
MSGMIAKTRDVLSQIDNHTAYSSVNGSHQLYLGSFLFHVILIDAKLVYPE